MTDQVIIAGQLVDRDKARCVDCGEPFKFGVNVFTKEGYSEVRISGTCEKCFDSYFEDDDE